MTLTLLLLLTTVQADRFDAFVSGHINGGSSTLSPRHRELLILRIGWLCRAEYEWAQHVQIGLKAGVNDEEIARVRSGAEDPGWSWSGPSVRGVASASMAA